MNADESLERLLSSSPTPTQLHDWIDRASIPELLRFIRRGGLTGLDYSRSVLKVRIAEDQAKSAEKLERHTVALLKFTRGLYYLTWVLVIQTAALLILTIRLVIHP